MEIPNNPDLIISKLKVKVGEKEVNAQVQEKDKAKQKYEDAIAAGHQAVMLGQKEDHEENVFQMHVGNIEPKQIVEVKISIIEQAKIFEGAYQIMIPRGLVLMLTECKQNSSLQIELNSSS